MYSIHELAEQFGLSVDTIRKYRHMGLIPPPIRHGNRYDRKTWGKHHVVGLQMIASMKNNRYTLEEIREKITA